MVSSWLEVVQTRSSREQLANQHLGRARMSHPPLPCLFGMVSSPPPRPILVTTGKDSCRRRNEQEIFAMTCHGALLVYRVSPNRIPPQVIIRGIKRPGPKEACKIPAIGPARIDYDRWLSRLQTVDCRTKRLLDSRPSSCRSCSLPRLLPGYCSETAPCPNADSP